MKVNLSYAMLNIAPQYEYTDAMYKEDYRIAHWCVHVKYASKFPEKSIAKEDLVQYCVTRLWQKRPTYDPTKSKYSTWAIIVCRSVLRNYSIVKRQFEDSQCDKLDRAIFTDELGNDFCLLETLGEPDKEPVDDLIRIIYQAVDSIHAPKMRTKAKQAVDLFMQGKVQYLAEVGKIMGCTREYCRLLVKKVRLHALQIVENGNIFSRQECERQLTITQQTPRPYINKNRYYSRIQKERKLHPEDTTKQNKRERIAL